MIWIYVVIGVGLVVAAVWLGYMVWRKDAADLARYLNRDGCPWERISRTSATPEAPELVYYHNVGPDASGVEMRAYDYSQFPGQGEYDEDGICLSVIDNSSGHGVVLNEFGRVLDALRFGDELWRDTFHEDPAVMQQMIEEKKEDWDQLQRDIMVIPYNHFM